MPLKNISFWGLIFLLNLIYGEVLPKTKIIFSTRLKTFLRNKNLAFLIYFSSNLFIIIFDNILIIKILTIIKIIMNNKIFDKILNNIF